MALDDSLFRGRQIKVRSYHYKYSSLRVVVMIAFVFCYRWCPKGPTSRESPPPTDLRVAAAASVPAAGGGVVTGAVTWGGPGAGTGATEEDTRHTDQLIMNICYDTINWFPTFRSYHHVWTFSLFPSNDFCVFFRSVCEEVFSLEPATKFQRLGINLVISTIFSRLLKLSA